MANLENIITSRVRVKLLDMFMSDINDMYHVRGIVRKTSEEINAVRRELKRMESEGFLRKESRGNRLYYSPRKDYIYFGDFLSIVAKRVGLGGKLLKERSKIGKIAYILFSGRFARKKKRKREDEIDVLIVGEVILPELSTIIRAEESKRESEINYTVMSREEYDFRKKRRDPFLLSILTESRVMILGDDEDLIGEV